MTKRRRASRGLSGVAVLVLTAGALVAGTFGVTASARAQSRLSFEEALSAATAHASGLVATEIRLLGSGDSTRYEVLFLTHDGTETFEVDAASGRVKQTEWTSLGPRAVQDLRRRLREADLSLFDAIQRAEEERAQDAELRRVAFQLFQGDLVIEVKALEEGEVVGLVLDTRSGRALGA